MNERLINSPIFISGHTRSGTSLLLRLLDSSEELLCPPGRAKLNVLRRLISMSNNSSETDICRYNRLQSVIELELKESNNEHFSSFLLKNIKKEGENGFKSDIRIILNSIAEFRKVEDLSRVKYWVEKNHNLEFYWNRAQLVFSNPYLVYIIRDPRDVWSSWKIECKKKGIELSTKQTRRNIQQHLIEDLIEIGLGNGRFSNLNELYAYYKVPEKNVPKLHECLSNVMCKGIHSDVVNVEIIDLESFDFSSTDVGGFCWNYRIICERAQWLHDSFMNRVMIIKYEELVQNPERILNEISDKCKIRLKVEVMPSDSGQYWGGNSSYTSGFIGVSDASMGRWKQYLDLNELEIISEIAIPLYERQSKSHV